MFGECKYWAGPVGMNVLASLQEKAKAVEWNRAARREDLVLYQ